MVTKKELVVLTIVTLVAVAVSTYINLNSITGFDVKSGTAQVQITGLAAITLSDSLIDFGTGAISVNYTYCNLNSNGGISPGCNTQGGTFNAVNDQFEIQNTGNVNCNIQGKTSADASTWIGGTNPSTYVLTATNTTNGGCVSVNNTAWRAFNTTDTMLCNNLTYTGGDTLMVDLNITLPDDASPASKQVTVTFTATQV